MITLDIYDSLGNIITKNLSTIKIFSIYNKSTIDRNNQNILYVYNTGDIGIINEYSASQILSLHKGYIFNNNKKIHFIYGILQYFKFQKKVTIIIN